MSAEAILKNTPPVDHSRAEGAQKQVLDKAKARSGSIPNMYAGMAVAPAVLDTYLHGYGLFRSESGFTPPEQEVVFLAASQSNGCDYCLAAHSMIADKVSKLPQQTLEEIRGGRPITDPKLAALYRLTTEMVRTHGRPASDVMRAFVDAGFEESKLLYIVLALAVKTLSNYSNHAFAPQVDERFSAYRVDAASAPSAA